MMVLVHFVSLKNVSSFYVIICYYQAANFLQLKKNPSNFIMAKTLGHFLFTLIHSHKKSKFFLNDKNLHIFHGIL